MKRHTLEFLTLSALAIAVGFGQTPNTTLGFDTSNLNVSVSLDRQTYLPGEVAQVTLEVANPASVPVTTLMPFIASTGCLYLRWTEKGRLTGVPSVDCVSIPIEPSNTATFKPGETKRLVLNSYDTVFDIGQPVMEGYGVPTLPGNYGITYWYGTTKATAEYTVAQAQLEADAVARVHDIMFSDNPQRVPPHAIPMYVHVLAVRSGGTSYICVQQSADAQSRLIARKEVIASKPSFDHKHVDVPTPLKRIGTSTNPVAGLLVTADSQENLTINWTDSTGKQQVLYYPASYPAFKRQ